MKCSCFLHGFIAEGGVKERNSIISKSTGTSIGKSIEIRRLVSMSEDELYEAAKQLQAPYDLVKYVHENGKLPVVNFAAGGVATPADAALMMQLGAEGVFVGSGIFKSGNPAKRAQAIVKAVTNYNDPKMLAELSEDLGEAMVGINEQEIALLMAERGK